MKPHLKEAALLLLHLHFQTVGTTYANQKQGEKEEGTTADRDRKRNFKMRHSGQNLLTLGNFFSFFTELIVSVFLICRRWGGRNVTTTGHAT